MNQGYKLTVLGSELERTKHLNFSVSHTVKRPIENKKKILVGYDLRRAITTVQSSRRRLTVGLPLLNPNS